MRRTRLLPPTILSQRTFSRSADMLMPLPASWSQSMVSEISEALAGDSRSKVSLMSVRHNARDRSSSFENPFGSRKAFNTVS